MEEVQKRAIAKLQETGKDITGRYAKAMQGEVLEALTEFVGQDAEFARAVLDGGTFRDCMSAVSKCVKDNKISDLRAYRAAADFYFPGCRVEGRLTIYMSEYDVPAGEEKTRATARVAPTGENGGQMEQKPVVLDLEAFL